MVCIYCGGTTQVTNSRLQKRNNAVWRRRQCLVCRQIFTTIESIDLASAVMIKDASGALEPFSRDKLLISIYDSCKHRSGALHDALGLTQTIIGDLIRIVGETGSLEKDTVIAASHAVLERFDPVAATVYMAYNKK